MLRYSKLIVALLVVLSAGCSGTSEEGAQGNTPLFEPSEALQLETSDGVTVYGQIHRPSVTIPTDSAGVPLILAFHQGGSSGEAEYAPIIPRLLEAGFAVMTIDQRRGGDRFLGTNRTAAAFDQETVSYCDVIPDMEAALEYARSLEDVGEIIAWGSSYSATLAVKLAVDHPAEISKVLAFSPASGEPMTGCSALPLAFQLRQQALFLRPDSEMSFGSAAADLAAFENMGHEIYIASPGAHGSSMLVPERAEGDTGATWEVVLDFLR